MARVSHRKSGKQKQLHSSVLLGSTEPESAVKAKKVACGREFHFHNAVRERAAVKAEGTSGARSPAAGARKSSGAAQRESRPRRRGIDGGKAARVWILPERSEVVL